MHRKQWTQTLHCFRVPLVSGFVGSNSFAQGFAAEELDELVNSGNAHIAARIKFSAIKIERDGISPERANARELPEPLGFLAKSFAVGEGQSNAEAVEHDVEAGLASEHEILVSKSKKNSGKGSAVIKCVMCAARWSTVYT